MNVPPEILAARRNLESIEGYLLLEDVKWLSSASQWHLKIRLTVDVAEGQCLVPAITDWHILIDKDYLWETIKLFPDKERGVCVTFEHQNNNNLQTDTAWRSGDPCLSTSFGNFSLRGFDAEPKGSINRLRWHVERCKQWIAAASRGELTLPGQFFELPHFPLSSAKRVIFCEDEQKYEFWKRSSSRFGTVELIHHPENKSLFISAFKDDKKRDVLRYRWNNDIDSPNAKLSTGLWILLNDVPVLPPWQSPLSWGELKKIGTEKGIEIVDLISKVYINAIDVNPSILLLGFPIPYAKGKNDIQIFWQPLALNPFELKHGFSSRKEAAKAAVKKIFHDTSPIHWLDGRNGHLNAVSTRGQLPKNMTDLRILQIGGGALGSVIAECLARGGCKAITIMDPDNIELGNMARHTLTLDSLDKNKARELSARLSSIYPELEVKGLPKGIEGELNFEPNLLYKYDLILDITGSDKVLIHLASALNPTNTPLISLSLGMEAKRLYFFYSPITKDIKGNFYPKINPWLEREREETANVNFPREGVGCWHPLFPAQASDIFMMAGAAVKMIVNAISGQLNDDLYILEQAVNEFGFQGITVIPNSKQ